ncbi:DUF2914 domain-containing protein [Nitrosomonas sp. Nm166]|uniref:DUF2914 domain-containing protein n=1 Tax=Nitrosomonas sp. Nm166 TaxID=1881054 RepID=UPI0008EA275B|nr:DUF2914 domain-containing protein [Nitrosomonas sp. Nm166]SFE48798.1 Protein of unknown function [Nitrosomonas sp. Nm166]
MIDNKLKIRIQIQQPHQAIEQIYPDLPEPEITYEQSLDWRKISIAVLLLILILALVDYVLSGTDQRKVPLSDTMPFIDQATSMQENKMAAEKAAPEPEIKDKPIANKSIEAQPEHNDSPNLAPSKGITQSEPIKSRVEPAKTSIAKPRPVPNVNRSIVIPRKKPKIILQSKPPKILDHSQVLRAQLSQAIEAHESVDAIDAIQLHQGESKPIYFYLHLKNLQGKKVSVAWYRNNILDSQLSLEIHNDNWRTYSSKQLDFQRLGIWRVELLDESGTQLAARNFTVTQH